MAFTFPSLSRKNLILIAVGLLVVGFGVYYYMSRRSESFTTEHEDVSSKPSTIDKKLVLFYSPKCGHCKTFMDGEDSTWNKLVATHGNTINMSAIDCNERPDLATENEITGYPTIKLFSNGQEHVYSGDRSMSDLEAFINSY
jgi:thioredoxin-like negative regulator of GroEL